MIPALRGDLQLKLLRGAAWRKAPATDSQKDFLKKRLAGGTDPSPLLEDEPSPSSSLNREESNFIRVGPLGKEIDLGSLTKGKAGDLITRLRHGLKGEWTKKRKAIDKVVKAETKEMAREALRRQRETVQVGPVA
jgi:ATP-dependent helicase IRC3